MSASGCCLTSKDVSILEVMLERRRGLGDPIVPLLERKLADARVVLVDCVPPDVATLNSRVTFRLDGGQAQTRTLIQQEVRGLVGLGLSLTTPLGLTLIGMAEGQETTVQRLGGKPANIRLERVLYQPEAARHAARVAQATELAKTAQMAAARRPALTLVHSAGDDWQPHHRPLGAQSNFLQRGGDDDGPSAA